MSMANRKQRNIFFILNATTCLTNSAREQILAKNNSLDLGLIRDDSIIEYEDLQDPIESGEEVIAKLEEAVDLIQSVVKELRSLEGR